MHQLLKNDELIARFADPDLAERLARILQLEDRDNQETYGNTYIVREPTKTLLRGFNKPLWNNDVIYNTIWETDFLDPIRKNWAIA